MAENKTSPFVVLEFDDRSEWEGCIPEPVERYMAGMADEIKRLRAVLQAVEWIADYDGVRWCPACRACWPEHVSTCRLKAALDAAGES